MCSQDSFGLIAYNLEPEYSAEELEELESIARGCDGEVTVDDDFCMCLNCAIMPSSRENVCYRENELVLPNLDSYDCIRDHAQILRQLYLVLLLYVPSQQLWSWRDGQFT